MTNASKSARPDPRERIVKRVARELKDGDYVNLGIGMPTLVAGCVPPGVDITLHAENGMLGVGPFPLEHEVDPDLINAGKETISETPGCSYFSSGLSFAMVRGGHVDLTVLGAFEVDVQGNIASYMIPGKLIKGMGGAMDLVAGAENIIVVMTHASKHGESKLLAECSLPLTGKGCIKRVLTDLALLDIEDGKFVLRERAPGVSTEEIASMTAGELLIPENVPEMQL
jgi:3-oxoacid CoA-transferase subunit B